MPMASKGEAVKAWGLSQRRVWAGVRRVEERMERPARVMSWRDE